MKKFLIDNMLYMLVAWPVVLSIIIYFLGVRLTKSKWKSIHKMVELTAVSYIIEDIVLIQHIFNVQVIGYTVIIIILILAIIIIRQWKKENEVSLIKGLRLMWRIIFPFFFALYIALLIYKLIIYLI